MQPRSQSKTFNKCLRRSGKGSLFSCPRSESRKLEITGRVLVEGFPFREVIVLSGQKRFFLKLVRCLWSPNAARQEIKSEMRYKRDRIICGTWPSGNSSRLYLCCFLTRSISFLFSNSRSCFCSWYRYITPENRGLVSVSSVLVGFATSRSSCTFKVRVSGKEIWVQVRIRVITIPLLVLLGREPEQWMWYYLFLGALLFISSIY